MEKEKIETQEELRNLYLKTDLTDIASVQATIKEIKDNAFVTGKEKYIEALNSAINSKISKATKYHNILSFGGYKTTILKNLGWIFAAVLFIAIMVIYPDVNDAPDLMYCLVWVGIGVQIYIYNLKSAWNKLTLDGSIVHPIIKGSK